MSMYDTSHKNSTKLLVLWWLVCALVLGITIDFLREVPPLPDIGEPYWGSKNDSGIRKYRVTVSQDELNNIRYKLTHHRNLTPPLLGIKQEYGFNSHLLEEIVDYWIHRYDWKEREIYMNKYQSYKTSIQGLDIHYVHVVPTNAAVKSLPILMLHGWPGSFIDFYKIIPHLTNESNCHNFVFEVIAPSMAGFIFSEGPQITGLGSPQQAVIFKNLMKRLGHEKFFVYGIDWGALVVSDIATLFPDNVLGLYSPLCLSFRKVSWAKYGFESLLPDFVMSKEVKSKYSIATAAAILWKEAAYFHFHSTKPDTLGVEVTDDPIGLAAHILQIVSSGSNVDENIYKPDGGLRDVFKYSDLIDMVMLQYISKSQTTTFRFYMEVINNIHLLYQIPIKDVPTSCPRFRNEIFYQSDWILRDKYVRLMQRTEFKSGGHFYLLENGDLQKRMYAEDLFASVKRMLNSTRKFRDKSLKHSFFSI